MRGGYRDCGDDGQGVALGLFQAVVDDDAVELRGKGELELSTGDALVDDLGGIGGAPFEAAAQLGDGGWLDEQAQGLVAIMALDVDTALHIDVEDNVLAGIELALDLCLQRAVEAVLVDLLVLEELVVVDAAAELLGGEEEILDAMLLAAARRPAGA